MTNYPAQIDTTTSLPTVVDNSTAAQGLIVNRLRDAILAIEDELGVKPSGIYGTIRSRFDTLETTIGNLQIIRLTSDLGGTLSNPLVIGIQGRPVSSVQPNLGDVLTWGGTAWEPNPAGSGGTNILSGDVTGIATDTTVVGLHKVQVSSTLPTINQNLVYDGTQWTPLTVAASAAQTTWYIDPVSGSDSNSGLTSGTAIKTLAEFHKRTQFGNVWTVTTNVNINFISYPPVTDPLRLVLSFTGTQVVSVFGPTLTTNSSGTFTGVTARNRATNTPYEVADGTVVTTGDVAKRIRIASGPRAGAQAWVAKSTGAGLRRTSEWCTWADPFTPTPIVPQVGDAYVIESSSTQCPLAFIEVIRSSGYGVFPSAPQLTFTNMDFTPAVANSVPDLVNDGSFLTFFNCRFTDGEWNVLTKSRSGDNSSSSTFFGNCCIGNTGINNLFFIQGSISENFLWAGVGFGQAVARGGSGGVNIDLDYLTQGNFSPPAAVQGGQLAICTMGVMDSIEQACVIIEDALVALTSDFGSFIYSTPALWGTSASSVVGVAVNAGSSFRYQSGSLITITGASGDFFSWWCNGS